MKNIILIGMPGCGKTTLGARLAEELKVNFIDFDDDILEKPGNPKIGEVLQSLGDDGFLDYEAKETLQLNFENTILATSGSQPLRTQAMNYLRGLGTVIWIDIPVENIENRLCEMKVDRIVGMGKMNLRDILDWRKSFYESNHDIRFSYPTNVSKEDMWQQFFDFLGKNEILV